MFVFFFFKSTQSFSYLSRILFYTQNIMKIRMQSQIHCIYLLLTRWAFADDLAKTTVVLQLNTLKISRKKINLFYSSLHILFEKKNFAFKVKKYRRKNSKNELWILKEIHISSI